MLARLERPFVGPMQFTGSNDKNLPRAEIEMFFFHPPPQMTSYQIVNLECLRMPIRPERGG